MGLFAQWLFLHIDVCTPNFLIQEGGIHSWFQEATIGDLPRQKDGYFGIPEGPGLGVSMDEEWLKDNPWDKQALPWRPTMGIIPSRQDVYWS